MNAAFQDRLRKNHILRALMLPMVRIKRKKEFETYRKGEDRYYIEKLKDTHHGERCFIIGNGPSLNATDLDLIKDEITFAFNRIYHIYEKTSWRPTYYMLIDKSIIKKMLAEPIPELGAHDAFVFSTKLANYWKENMNVHEIFLTGKTPIQKEKFYIQKISEDVSNHFSTNQSVTINAFEFAFYMGFSEIYLLGVDHNFTHEVDMNGKKIKNNVASHFDEDEDKDAYETYKEALTKCYETCRDYADAHNIKVINMTRGGKLEVFPRGAIEELKG